ncbi:MAG: hypothetical protein HFE39_07280 [Clostridiales bacterium]|jgi:hypothetical protein|nr:hypothetical protein [Clostridiales bacterium]
MSNLTITIEAPEIVKALTALTAALQPVASPASKDKPLPPISATKLGQSTDLAQPAPVQAAPVYQAPVTSPVQIATPTETTADDPAPQAPTAAPSFTVEQVGKAGADLLAADPGKMPELLGLLNQFGAQAITELKPDQIGAFATALRGLGAKI